MDFTIITPRLATGAAISTLDDVDALFAAGIRAVIDCRAEYDDGNLLLARPGLFTYIWNGTDDDGQTKPPAWFEKSWDFALDQFKKPGIVYCHCAAGINRGPSTAYAIMLACGWYPAAAKIEIESKRPATVAGLRYAADAEAAVKSLLGL